MALRARVLILNERDLHHPAAGGAEVHVQEIGDRLATMGFEVIHASVRFPGAAPCETIGGIEVWRLGGLATYYPRVLWTCARETRRGRFDVVIEHLNKVPFCAAAYSAVPVIAVNHHLFGKSAFLQVRWPIAATVVSIERLIPWIYRHVSIVAVSQSSKDDLIRRGLEGDPIRIIHNGIRFPKIEPRPMSQRPCRIAYLGRLEPYKRVDRMLHALAPLAERHPDLEIVVIGRGTALESLQHVARESGLEKRTRFVGFVSDTERDTLLRDARVCVCPSVKEGWGITVIEANAVGVPVVATCAPGLRDAVQDEKTGLLVEDGEPETFSRRLGHAIDRLLLDEPLAARLADAAYRWSRNFDWDSAATKMAEIIEAARSRA